MNHRNSYSSNYNQTSTHINLLLVGTSGNGISSTANTIIGTKTFNTSSNCSSASKNVVKNSRSFHNLVINVVDVPGVDTDNTSEEYQETFEAFINDAFDMVDNGFSSVVFVCRYGQRFTRQEMKTIKLLKATLGDDIFKNYVICLLTHGDEFEENRSLSFLTWCRMQEGSIRQLFEECNYRCLLFNNRVPETSIMSAQVQTLIQLVNTKLKYLPSDFTRAEPFRKEIRKEIAMPKLKQKTEDKVRSLRSKMFKIETEHRENNQEIITELKTVLRELDRFEKDIMKELVPDSDLKMSTVNHLQGLKCQIESKLRLRETEETLNSAKRACEKPEVDINPKNLDVSITSSGNTDKNEYRKSKDRTASRSTPRKKISKWFSGKRPQLKRCIIS